MTIDPRLKILLNEMVHYPTRDNVLPKYIMVLREIKSIFSQIQECKSFEESNKYFDQLQEIHGPLAILVFKEKIDGYPSIDKFVRDFDRVDDIRLRDYMFKQTKEGNYSLSSENQ